MKPRHVFPAFSRTLATAVLCMVAAIAVLQRPCAASPRSSAECGECHKEIYRMWSRSAHAKAMEDEIFLDAFRLTQAHDGDEASRTCLQCHAPLAEINKDLSLSQKATWEGVNCDVCHGLVSVDTTGPALKMAFEIGDVKRGPIRDAASGAHEVAYSELHTTSLACAGCHEFVNADGTPVMTTYSEWKASRAAAEGKNCQECHMGRVKGAIVDPKIARVPGAEVNIHEVPGGHSLDQLHKALRVTMDSRREGDVLALDVHLTNIGAGHAVPTGMPGRRVILDLNVRTSGGTTFDESRTFAKFFVDAEGRRITEDGRNFGRGVRLESDSRIQPDERRSEPFRFDVPSSATAYITAQLIYEHAPTGGTEGMTRVTFYSDRRILQPAKSGAKGAGAR